MHEKEPRGSRDITKWQSALLIAELDRLASVLRQEHLVALLHAHWDGLSTLKVGSAWPDCHHPALAHLAQTMLLSVKVALQRRTTM